MAIARVSVLEFDSQEALEHAQKSHKLMRAKVFPHLKMCLCVRTGPTSFIDISVYPSEEAVTTLINERAEQSAPQHDEDVLKLLREIDVHLHDGLDVVSACRKAGISDKSYYYWRKKFGGLSRSQVSEMKSLKKENERLKKIVADLQLDKVILKESLDHLKPRA